MKKILLFACILGSMFMGQNALAGGGYNPCTDAPDACPQLEISLDKTSFLETEDIVIHWKSTNGIACLIDGEHKTSGTSITRKYRSGYVWFTCKGGLSSGLSNSIYVHITPVPVIGELHVSKSTINEGESVNISWDVKNAEKCWLGGQPVAHKMSYSITPEWSKPYYLYCERGYQRLTSIKRVDVIAKPVSIELSLDQNTITKGDSTTLRWNTTNAKSCKLNGQTVATQGAQRVAPSGSVWYVLNCSSGRKTAHSQKLLRVNFPVAPAANANVVPSMQFQQSAVFLSAGQSSQISWQASAGATSCSASWDSSISATSGTATITPTQSGFTTYNIICNYSNWPHPYTKAFSLHLK